MKTQPIGALRDEGSGLSSFLEPVRSWFDENFDAPTPPQTQGWPAIQRGEHTLILAPTGSGKTLAAFLWGIDRLFRELADVESVEEPGDHDEPRGVRLLYISPLKALNNDIHRNLRLPLAGIRRKADEVGASYPPIQMAVRSGDTPQRERQAMVRKPPHILITTPESFYLLLTSPKAREMFRTVRTVIVDEIHTLAGNKRGVHLSLSLERLQQLADQPVQRLGLSATIQPLDTVARFLGGSEWQGEDKARKLVPRPVSIVDAAYEKPLDLQVVTVVADFRNLPGDSIWPTIIPRVLSLIREHQTTLVFANNRRLAERTADRLNEQRAAEEAGETTGLIEGGVAKGVGFMAAGSGASENAIRVHHGSIAKEARLSLERKLKAGELPALVGTASLELGIDIGAVDLIVHLQSPKSVSQGLQRVGRSGHMVGETSKGRIFPTHREDVIEAAAIAGGMLRGEVEPTHTPRQPLDVLAQQIVAMVSVQPWDVDALADLVCCAYAYNDLTRNTFLVTLEMLAGRYPSQAFRELRPRLAWDRVNSKLAPLPGSRWLALTNGGTIPDTGSFSAMLSDGKTKLGELDEEFVFETRIGDTLMLGSQVWRVIDLTDDKVVVAEAPGAVPRMPFWRGDQPWRPYDLGRRVGAFRRNVTERLEQVRKELDLDQFREIRELRDDPVVVAALEWLEQDHALDAFSAWQVLDYLAGQLDHTAAASSDRTILVEVFEDSLGDSRLVVHSPFGGRVNGPWGLALTGALRERTGVEVEVQTNDDGILLRLLDADAAFPLDIVSDMGPAEARERILQELPNSAVFGARFRQNAARALLLPGVRGGKRTPFWLQRLRARDLLQVVRRFDDFPIVAETYRDCLQDVLDLPHLEEILSQIQRGEIEVVAVESVNPSPVAQSLLWDFINVHMYEWDAPRAEQQIQMLAVNRDLLQDLLKDIALDELLRPEAIADVRGQLQRSTPHSWARTAEELAVLLQQIGDLSSSEIGKRAASDPGDWVAQLSGDRRIVQLLIPTARGPRERWVAAEYAHEYAAAFGLSDPEPSSISPDEAQRRILDRFLVHSGPVTIDDITVRYAFPDDWLQAELDRRIKERDLVHGRFTPQTGPAAPPHAPEYIDSHTLEQIHRRTLAILRKEVRPVPYPAYADFLARWQHVAPTQRFSGRGALAKVLQQLRAAAIVGRVWERDVLPLRLEHYQAAELEELCQSGGLVWIGSGGSDPRRGRVRFLFRGEGNVYLEPAPEDLHSLTENARHIHSLLKSEGAVFFDDICSALELKTAAAETAIVELVMAGLATNDSLVAMRKLIEHGSPQSGPRQPFSPLEEQLSRRRGQRAPRVLQRRGRPSPARYRAAKKRVQQRLARPTDAQAQPSRWLGRWTLVHRFGVMGKAVPVAERTAQQARQLLSRYGIVTRECLADEVGSWQWGLIYQQLKRMEMRGEVRRGYFVQGLPGLQFALPEAVEQLRAIRDTISLDPQLVVMNACDPANLYGLTRDDLPSMENGEKLAFARVPSTWLVLDRGLPVVLARDSGANLATVEGATDVIILRALETLLNHLSQLQRRLVVQQWNGQSVLESAGRVLLEKVGFHRDYPGMAWERPA